VTGAAQVYGTSVPLRQGDRPAQAGERVVRRTRNAALLTPWKRTGPTIGSCGRMAASPSSARGGMRAFCGSSTGSAGVATATMRDPEPDEETTGLAEESTSQVARHGEGVCTMIGTDTVTGPRPARIGGAGAAGTAPQPRPYS